jgi:hypothetical protein
MLSRSLKGRGRAALAETRDIGTPATTDAWTRHRNQSEIGDRVLPGMPRPPPAFVKPTPLALKALCSGNLSKIDFSKPDPGSTKE